MQQTFQAHTTARTRPLRAPGRLSLTLGTVLVLLLLLGNIAALILGGFDAAWSAITEAT